MAVTTRDAPLLVRYVPETHLRILGRRWKLDSHFSGETAKTYADWIRTQEASLASLYGYKPTASQLKRSVAAAIEDDEEFLEFLCDTEGTEVLESDQELAKLAYVAACIIVGLYSDRATLSTSETARSTSRGA